MQTSPFAVSQLLTSLVDRPVHASRVDEVDFSSQVRFAVYGHEQEKSTILVKIDLQMLAGFAGLLIGLPAVQTDSMAARGALDDDLTDAAREVMNILASVVVDEGRAYFRGLYTHEAELPAEARALQRLSAFVRMSLRCSIANRPAGFLTIYFPY